MSSVKGVVNRNAKTSGKNSTTNTALQNSDTKDAVPNKTHEKEKLQPTAEQLRIAKIIDLKPDEEISSKIKQVMQITQKTEDEVVIALHDNALDIALTIDALLEGPQVSWSTTGKKKKNRASSVNKKEKDDLMKNGEADGDAEWDETITQAASITAQNNGGFSERRSRGRGGRGGFTNRPRPTEGGQRFGESRRERENKENEKNLAEDGASGENRNFRSDSRGSRRGVNGPRYNGRSRGTRMFQNSERGNSGPGSGNNSGFSQPIDTWFNPTAKESKKENWGTFPSPEDWDNEEYTGSLADTKVFTPSGGTESTVNNEVEVPKPNENAYLEVEDWNDAVQAPNQQAAAANSTASEKLAASIANSKTLTPEQSQYLSSLTQESQQKKVVPLPPAATTFNSHPPVEFVSSPFEENSMGPGKKPTLRARIPPPSKIPLSAVEMPPDDSSVNINFLDVSFGAVDLSGDVPQLCDPSQDQNSLPPVVKYDDSVAQKVDSVLTQTEYSTISNQASVQTQRSPQVNQAPQPSTKIGPPPGVPPPADYLTKQNAAVANPYQNINAGQPTSMYNSSVYSNNPQGLSSHTSLYGTTASNIGVNSTNPHIPQLSQSNHSILNANYPQTAAQPQFPSYSYPNPHSYQASGISYPPIVSAANLASMYTPSTYSNYIHQNLHQTGNTNLSKSTVSLTSTTNSTKESLYDQSQPSNNSLTSSASNPNGSNLSGTTSSIGLAQSTLLTSKSTTPTTNKSGVISGMPPGVAPLVGAQYILSQQGIPGYYHQSHPVMYSEEHLQMVQSRLPHHMTNFYSPDPMYPSVSSSLTGRETAGTGISNVAGYSSLTDSRYARTDNNASPVSSTLSQQQTGTLAHQQALLNPPITPGFTYYYGQSVIPANPFQYGTMYPMAPAASATSHGTGATNTMSGYSKTAAAPTGYNNVYETLGSSSVTGSSNDYGSSSKVGVSGQQTSQAQGKTNSSDLAAMYSSKSTLNKPYDKQQQSFQSPPPFSVTLNNGGVSGHHSAGSYAPVFISPLPPGNPQPHHIAPLHHQIDMRVQNRQGQELSNGTGNMSRNQSVNPTTSKVNVKQNYSQGATPYWNSN